MNFNPKADYVRLLFSAGLCLLDFAMKIGCFKSERDAARIIEAGGFYVNQVVNRWWDEFMSLPWPDKIAFRLVSYIPGKVM